MLFSTFFRLVTLFFLVLLFFTGFRCINSQQYRSSPMLLLLLLLSVFYVWWNLLHEFLRRILLARLPKRQFIEFSFFLLIQFDVVEHAYTIQFIRIVCLISVGRRTVSNCMYTAIFSIRFAYKFKYPYPKSIRI